jgi:hypothetical protein
MTDLLHDSYYVSYLMYPPQAENTLLVVRDQQEVGHISLGNNSIEIRKERCECWKCYVSTVPTGR